MLCAIEACEEFVIPPSQRILIVYQFGENAEDLFQTISQWEKSFWPTVYFLANTQHLKFVHNIPWFKKAVEIYKGKVERVFVSNQRRSFNNFIHRVSPTEVWLYDDGTATKEIVQKRSERSRRSNFKKVLRKCMKNEPVEILNYFTCFDIQPGPSEKIVKNRFISLQAELQDRQKNEGQLLFLGGPLAEENIMPREAYLSMLEIVSSCSKYRSILYYPHRREMQDDLYAISDIEKVTVQQSTGPIELELKKMPCKPEFIASFFSSALVTLPLIYGEKFNYLSFVIPEKKIHGNERKRIIEIYKNFKNEKVELINL